MRRIIVFFALAVFTLGLTGGSAQAMSSGPDVTFEVWCDEAGIEAEGRIAGWLGMMLVESGEGVSAGSVGVLWSFTQETWQDTGPNGEPDSVGTIDRPGAHPGAETGCEGVLQWTYRGLPYYAEIYNVEVTFTPVGRRA